MKSTAYFPAPNTTFVTIKEFCALYGYSSVGYHHALKLHRVAMPICGSTGQMGYYIDTAAMMRRQAATA